MDFLEILLHSLFGCISASSRVIALMERAVAPP